MKNSYYEQREKRIDRYRELALQNQELANRLSRQSSGMAKQIPLGQPILIGHHSEARDRNFRNKIHTKIKQTVDASDKAEYYTKKAAAADSNRNISSDNPNAISLLKEKIDNLEKLQDKMKTVNKLLKKGSRAELLQMGYSEQYIEKLFTPDRCGRMGYPSFILSNNRKRITDTKKRLDQLEKQAKEITTVTKYDNIGLLIIDSVEDNRLQLYFDDKPCKEIREVLKQNGFIWCNTLKCWQVFRGLRANYKAESMVNFLMKRNNG